MKIRPLSPISLIKNSVYRINSEHQLKDEGESISNNNGNQTEIYDKNLSFNHKKQGQNTQEAFIISTIGYQTQKNKTAQSFTENKLMCSKKSEFIDTQVLNVIDSINFTSNKNNQMSIKQWEVYETTINDVLLESDQQNQLCNISFVIKKLNNFAMQQIEKTGNLALAQRVLNTCFNWLDFFGTQWLSMYPRNGLQSITSIQTPKSNYLTSNFENGRQQLGTQNIAGANFLIILNETILSLKGLTMNNQGSAFRRKGQFWAALEIFNEALGIIQNAKRKEYLGLTYLNISILYSSLGNHNLSLESANNALIEQQKLFFEKNYSPYISKQKIGNDNNQSPGKIISEKQVISSQNSFTNIGTTLGLGESGTNLNSHQQKSQNSQYKISRNVSNKNSIHQKEDNTGINEQKAVVFDINFSDLYFYEDEREDEFLQQVNTLAISYFNIAAEMEYYERWEEALRHYEYSYICSQKYFGDNNCVTLQFYEEFKLFQSRHQKIKIEGNINEARKSPQRNIIGRSFSQNKERPSSHHRKLKVEHIQSILMSNPYINNINQTKESEKGQTANQNNFYQFVTGTNSITSQAQKFILSLSPSRKNRQLITRHRSLHLNQNKIIGKEQNTQISINQNYNSFQQSLLQLSNNDQNNLNQNGQQNNIQNKLFKKFNSQTPSNRVQSASSNKSKRNIISSSNAKHKNHLYSVTSPKDSNIISQNNLRNGYQEPYLFSQTLGGNQSYHNSNGVCQNDFIPQHQTLVNNLINSPKQTMQTQQAKAFIAKSQPQQSLHNLQTQKTVYSLNSNINNKVPLIERIQQFSQQNKQKFSFNQIDQLKNENEQINEHVKNKIHSSQNQPMLIEYVKNRQSTSPLKQDRIGGISTSQLPYNMEMMLKNKKQQHDQNQIIKINNEHEQNKSPQKQPQNQISTSKSDEQANFNYNQHLMEDNQSEINQSSQEITSNNEQKYRDKDSTDKDIQVKKSITQLKNDRKSNQNISAKEYLLKRTQINKTVQDTLQKVTPQTQKIYQFLRDGKQFSKHSEYDHKKLKQNMKDDQNLDSDKQFDDENNNIEPISSNESHQNSKTKYQQEQEDIYMNNNQNLNEKIIENTINKSLKNNEKNQINKDDQIKMNFYKIRQSLPNLDTLPKESKNKIIKNQMDNYLMRQNNQNQNRIKSGSTTQNKEKVQQNQILFIHKILKKKLDVQINNNSPHANINSSFQQAISQRPYQIGSLQFTIVGQTNLIASYDWKDDNTNQKFILLHSFDVSSIKKIAFSIPFQQNEQDFSQKINEFQDSKYTAEKLNSGFYRDILKQLSQQISNFFIISPHKQCLLIDYNQSTSNTLRVNIKNFASLEINGLSDDQSKIAVLNNNTNINQQQQQNQDQNQNTPYTSFQQGNMHQDQELQKLSNNNNLIDNGCQPISSPILQTEATPGSSLVLSSPSPKSSITPIIQNNQLNLIQQSQSNNQLVLEQIDELEELKPILYNKQKSVNKLSDQKIQENKEDDQSDSDSSITPIVAIKYKKPQTQIKSLQNFNKQSVSKNKILRTNSGNSINPIFKKLQDCSPINNQSSPFVSSSEQDPIFSNYLKDITPIVSENYKINLQQIIQLKPTTQVAETPIEKINTSSSTSQQLDKIEAIMTQNKQQFQQTSQKQINYSIPNQTEIQISMPDQFLNKQNELQYQQGLNFDLNGQLVASNNLMHQINQNTNQNIYNNQINMFSHMGSNENLQQNIPLLNNLNNMYQNNQNTKTEENMLQEYQKQYLYNQHQQAQRTYFQQSFLPQQYVQQLYQQNQYPELYKQQPFVQNQLFPEFYYQNPQINIQQQNQQTYQLNPYLNENQLQQILLQNQMFQQNQIQIPELQQYPQLYQNSQGKQESGFNVQNEDIQQIQINQENLKLLQNQNIANQQVPTFQQKFSTSQTEQNINSLNTLNSPSIDFQQEKSPQNKATEIKSPIRFDTQISVINVKQDSQITSLPGDMSGYSPSLVKLNIQNPMDSRNSIPNLENQRNSENQQFHTEPNKDTDSQENSSNNYVPSKKVKSKTTILPQSIGQKPDGQQNNNGQRRYSQFYLLALAQQLYENSGQETSKVSSLSSQDNSDNNLQQKKDDFLSSNQLEKPQITNIEIKQIESKFENDDDQADQNLSASGLVNILSHKDLKTIKLGQNQDSNTTQSKNTNQVNPHQSQDNYNSQNDECNDDYEDNSKTQQQFENRAAFDHENNIINVDLSIVYKKNNINSNDISQHKNKRNDIESFKSEDIYSQQNWNEGKIIQSSKQIGRNQSNDSNLYQYFSGNQNISQINKPNDYNENFGSGSEISNGNNQDENYGDDQKGILQSTSQIHFSKRENGLSQTSVQSNDQNTHININNQQISEVNFQQNMQNPQISENNMKSSLEKIEQIEVIEQVNFTQAKENQIARTLRKKQSVPQIIISKVSSQEDETENKDEFSEQENNEDIQEEGNYTDDEDNSYTDDDEQSNNRESTLNQNTALKKMQTDESSNKQETSIYSVNGKNKIEDSNPNGFLIKKSTKEIDSPLKREQKKEFYKKQTLNSEEYNGSDKNIYNSLKSVGSHSARYSSPEKQMQESKNSKKQLDLKIKINETDSNPNIPPNNQNKDFPPIRPKSESLMIKTDDNRTMTPKIKEKRRDSLMGDITSFQNQLQILEQNAIENRRSSQTFTNLKETDRQKQRRESIKNGIVPDFNYGTNWSSTNLYSKMACIEENQTDSEPQDSEGEVAIEEKRNSLGFQNRPKKITFEHNIRIHALQQSQNDNHDQQSPYFTEHNAHANGMQQTQNYSQYHQQNIDQMQTRFKAFTFDKNQNDSLKNNLSKIQQKEQPNQSLFSFPQEEINELQDEQNKIEHQQQQILQNKQLQYSQQPSLNQMVITQSQNQSVSQFTSHLSSIKSIENNTTQNSLNNYIQQLQSRNYHSGSNLNDPISPNNKTPPNQMSMNKSLFSSVHNNNNLKFGETIHEN